tara:strand:- start:34738 stop:35628 length:891 start_codon:yes stop_codon:yes gene_type:complete
MTLEDNTPAPAAAPSGIHPTLARIEADTNADNGVGAASAEANGASPIASPQSLEIDIGGTKRAVSVKDLQDAFVNKLNVEQQSAALDTRLQQAGHDGQFRALQEKLAALPPQRQAQVLELIHGTNKPVQRPVGNPTADDLMREALGDTGSQDDGPPQSGIDQEDFNQLRHVVGQLANRHVANERADQQKSAGERVDKLMSDFPVLRGDTVSSSFAKDHILNQFAQSNGQLDLGQAVQQAATRAQQLRDGQASREQPMQRGGARLALPNNAQPNAQALQNGSIANAALDWLRNQAQG